MLRVLRMAILVLGGIEIAGAAVLPSLAPHAAIAAVLRTPAVEIGVALLAAIGLPLALAPLLRVLAWQPRDVRPWRRRLPYSLPPRSPP